MIAAHFPSLLPEAVDRVLAFYLENQRGGDAYVAAYDQEIERQMVAGVAVPSIAELRQRVQKMNAAASKAG